MYAFLSIKKKAPEEAKFKFETNKIKRNIDK